MRRRIMVLSLIAIVAVAAQAEAQRPLPTRSRRPPSEPRGFIGASAGAQAIGSEFDASTDFRCIAKHPLRRVI